MLNSESTLIQAKNGLDERGHRTSLDTIGDNQLSGRINGASATIYGNRITRMQLLVAIPEQQAVYLKDPAFRQFLKALNSTTTVITRIVPVKNWR